MKKTHKEEVLDWIKDWKEGLVNPPEPIIVKLNQDGLSIDRRSPENGNMGMVLLSLDRRDDHPDWHTAHTILRVDVWEEYKSWFTESTFGK